MSCPQVKRKPMNKIGNVQKKTSVAVTSWKKTQPSNHQGYWECYICHKMIDYLIAEHVNSKVRHPDLRTDTDNLRPVCNSCNQEKGSNDYEE